MFARKKHLNRSLIPSFKRGEKGFSLEERCIPEKIFYGIVDRVRSVFNSEINREKSLFFDQFSVDVIIFFTFFYLIYDILYFFPLTIFSNDPSNVLIDRQLFLLAFLISLLWGGFVYTIQLFKNLTREKIMPFAEKDPRIQFDFARIFRQFFRGFQLEWDSGLKLNVYMRSSLIGLFTIGFIIYTMKDSLAGFLSGIIVSHNLDALISLYLSLFVFSLGAFIVFFVFLTLLSVLVIFFYLLFVVALVPLEINSLQDMGGTGQFGRFIINCMYLTSVAFGMILVIPFITKPNSSTSFLRPEDTLGHAVTFVKDEAVRSINAMPVSSLAKYTGYIEVFVVLAVLALVIIIALHYRIKRSKEEKLTQLEHLIADIDLTSPKNNEDNLYSLALYEKVRLTSEWPIKKIFILELIVASLPILASILMK
jgi:hypothetical protein